MKMIGLSLGLVAVFWLGLGLTAGLRPHRCGSWDKHNGFETKTDQGGIEDQDETKLAISVDTHTAIHTVDRRFLSTGVGTEHVISRQNLYLNSSGVGIYLGGLAPAVFRVSGRTADETVFVVGNHSDNAITDRPIPVDSCHLTPEIWDKLNGFTEAAGVDLAYGLNVLLRKRGSWDPSNAKLLFDFTCKRGFSVIWQLGNEPLRFEKNFNMTVSSQQLGKDYVKLREILSDERFANMRTIIGPEIDHLAIRGNGTFQENGALNYLTEFLEVAGNAINATSVHFYNINKDNTTTLTDLVDPAVVHRTVEEIEAIRGVLNASHTNGAGTLWLGETSSVNRGGLAEASNRFVAGFILINNLGEAARRGVSIFVYWNLLGGNYGLVSQDKDTQHPYALYWVAYMHKRLVGTRVLKATSSLQRPVTGQTSRNEAKYVKVFAHCTRDTAAYPAGAVTLMAINLSNSSVAKLSLTGQLANKMVDEYHLTTKEGLNATTIYLNGKKMKMADNTTFPVLTPRPLATGSPISLPPLTYGFYVIKDAAVRACMK